MFSTYTGIFTCHECHDTVSSLRLWHDTLEITWRCDDGHISRVDLSGRKYARR